MIDALVVADAHGSRPARGDLSADVQLTCLARRAIIASPAPFPVGVRGFSPARLDEQGAYRPVARLRRGRFRNTSASPRASAALWTSEPVASKTMTLQTAALAGVAHN